MKTSCLLAALSFLLLTGCNDSPPPPGKANSAPTETGSSFAQPANAMHRAQKTVDLAAINKAIETFYLQEGRFPTNLVELALRDYIPMIPVLPVGMVWDYETNTGTVNIIKEAVKE
jgi:hypothetical protein